MRIIAISRGTFSGGEALAKAVAERLGYRCTSREVLVEAAREYEIPVDELIAGVETAPSLWDRLVGTRTAYLAFVQAALCEEAQAGNLVYHGYAGHLLLPGIAHVIRIRVIAEMEMRLEAVMQQRHLGREAAGVYIHKVDRERRRWVQFLFGVEWEDPRLYDLVINLGRVRLQTACDTVARLVECEEFRPTVESLRAMSNLTLASRVSAVLARDPEARGADLEVAADDGVVTITGTAHWAETLDAVLWSVREVEGVRELRLNVDRPESPMV